MPCYPDFKGVTSMPATKACSKCVGSRKSRCSDHGGNPASIPEPPLTSGSYVHMPGSDTDDNDGDHASGLLQNILERLSNGEPRQAQNRSAARARVPQLYSIMDIISFLS